MAISGNTRGKDDSIERRHYTLEELLENFEMDGHQNPTKFIFFDSWIAIPLVAGIYTLSSTLLLVTLFLVLLSIRIKIRHKGTQGILGWYVKMKRIWFTGTKKMPRHHASC
ncbi:MAG: hypothetical protein IBX50_06060 [Marinospirillum sp.]|uniref:hypothetical protein n=1 Tax=Marinospirillum sp. TaxID=2183934 RepID=UPI0019FD2BE2|nr:hypothetical protein [Marinospirillum sp.]MBE0506271.1 hypothetical protein [Marinospirillum sp.]